MTPSRRDFMKGALGVAGAAAIGTRLAGSSGLAPAVNVGPAPGLLSLPLPTLPDPAGSGIDHVVVVMMENRSFDHFLGWMPNSVGRQSGLSYLDPKGTAHDTWHANQLNGCGFADPDHSYDGGRIQYAGGAMDGFLLDPANDTYAISY
ncbi:MAG TPA: alkaline phosphatase family protein, partial [Acidimicrobiales bacterium]|nr:alkaline phosphatase family protein [Acidimicrobiales bacterium]